MSVRQRILQHVLSVVTHILTPLLFSVGQIPQAHLFEVDYFVHAVARPAHMEHVGAEGARDDFLHLVKVKE